ncbi:phosphopantothenoylcysteine decarboxylase [[Mycoplasma] mobile]|uniref:Pantothenate metabolism flavoprotein n=1 Tax=Mycoplasma mobile (strain ATCC 43663 / 163K / NCTC 11711) TaxID=267748 RepID=Q6KH53_MYCM1|nr:phosphopantothenoylcysteine decarboxylase [[Mycoplasma] mobile]AAT28078.1 pantothenate metabolism flavoprotein [Mycoplasma mobile 163K]
MKQIGIIVTSSVAIIKIKTLKEILFLKGFEVFIILTTNALIHYKNIQELNPVLLNQDLTKQSEHIAFVKRIDLFIMAPASANSISKFVNGICDNMALAMLMATNKPILFAPSMNDLMYESILKRNHIETLENWGHYIIGPMYGKLSEGYDAIGRMAEPEEIADFASNILNNQKTSKKVIVSYGASKIYLDPIRFISNDSSGLFGKLIIKELKLLGFYVDYVDASKNSNQQILDKVKDYDIYISSAAISDFLVEKSERKIKKNSIKTLELKNNIDVLTELRKLNKNIKILGFKLDEDIQNAKDKMQKLNLDGILYNQINSMNTSKINGTLFINNQEIQFQNKAKYELAKIIAKEVAKWIYT